MPAAITSLRPTQITVGMREVKTKRKRWRETDRKEKGGEFLGKHMIPVVLGPKENHYIIDHHWLAPFMMKASKRHFTVIADLSKLDPDAFWLC